MKPELNKPETTDDYIAGFPESIQTILRQIRDTIRKAAPEAGEKISYQMPAFTLKGILVYFAAYKNHIGFYPVSSAIKAFKDKLTAYETSKGTIRFPINRPIPLTLIAEIVKYRVKENEAKAAAKKSKVVKKP